MASGRGPYARRDAAPVTILAYHSVTSADLPSASAMNVPEGELVSAIETIRRVAEIVPLRTVVERHRAGRSTRGLVALTFDDAYAALPSVMGHYFARAAVPITVFVTTAATDSGATFWWDRIDDLFPRVSADRWRAFEDVVGVPSAYRAGQPAEFGPLRPLRQWVLAEYRGRWPRHLEEPLSALEREYGVTTRHRAMTWAELAAFTASGLVDVGVHTVSHPVLPLLDDTELEFEITECHKSILSRVPAAVPVLAIPFGLYDERTVRLARNMGMSASLTLANRSLRGVGIDEALPRLSMGRGLRRWKFLMRLLVPRRPPTRYPALPSATT